MRAPTALDPRMESAWPLWNGIRVHIQCSGEVEQPTELLVDISQAVCLIFQITTLNIPVEARAPGASLASRPSMHSVAMQENDLARLSPHPHDWVTRELDVLLQWHDCNKRHPSARLHVHVQRLPTNGGCAARVVAKDHTRLDQGAKRPDHCQQIIGAWIPLSFI
ncbi:hypothetical protein VOLCADRAFT_99810 [Volvox carteri f. nagariensis]|uniref:Uncharacterized protein n=1 Tax=Volvox carteri f. nagariensis TaxID=3068 RepID=D8UIQ1_VOLCA|nr:uncharacterized protein VOLCADRAFT_99810 [Volvox carteri f. nagariensis]EFJ40380.1 hypothetical protein VOLCADRAFT_99810 [Volvox carteri f. nagariensis]|eukprot:XP_002958531.1 hypothetical protein VOLCADRAFT_99810 [Volvox carteri f. nagariensis]